MQYDLARLKRQNLLHGSLVGVCVVLCITTVVVFASVGQERRHTVFRGYNPAQEQRLARSDVVVALLPLGDLSEVVVDAHQEMLEHRLGARVLRLPAAAVPASSFHGDRQQYHARAVLDWLYLQKPSEATHILAVTGVDLYADDWDFLYGYSQLGGRVAVYSMARLMEGDLLLARSRMTKIVFHELGHTFGLPHCTSHRCVMHAARDTAGIDQLPETYCHRCARGIEKAELESPDPVARAVERADGLYRRGYAGRAHALYAVSLLQRPTDPELLNRMGVASMQTGQLRVAELAFQTAVEIRPEDPRPYYNLGLLYAPLDAELGMQLLEMGLAWDPDRVEAFGALGRVHLEVFGDELRALRYFERYVDEGGREPSVLYRYQSLVQGQEVKFEEGTEIRSTLGSTGALWAFRWGFWRMQLQVVMDSAFGT